MTDKKYIDYIIGKGEVGEALGEVLTPSSHFVQFVDPAKGIGIDDLVLMSDEKVRVLHICFRLGDRQDFSKEINGYAMAIPHDCLIIHSTVMPGELNGVNGFDYVYSPVRGQHDRLAWDLKRYAKYVASESFDMKVHACNRLAASGMVVQCIKDVDTLIWAKHLANTLYYHWILAYRQYVHIWCKELKLDEEALWGFTKELHDYTGIQYPTYFDPKGIGGHCVLQNSELLSKCPIIPESLEDMLDRLIRLNDKVKGGSMA